jgi:pimeloyl-ACP methyl ester carboxylesterase
LHSTRQFGPLSGRRPPFSKSVRHWISIFLSFALTGCATLVVKIDHRREDLQIREDRKFAAQAKEVGSADAVALFNQAQGFSLQDERRLTFLLASARSVLASRDFTETGERLYNAAVRQVVAMLGAGGIQDRATTGPGGTMRLVVARTGVGVVDPAQWNSLVATTDVRIKRLLNRSVQRGWGVTYVAYFPRSAVFLKNEPGIPKVGMCLPATALLTFRGDTATLSFLNSLAIDAVTLSDRKVPLAADYSAAIAVLLSHSKNRSIDLGALFFTRRRLSEIGLYQLEPYDPEKIPVVFVHGLLSRPEAWTQAVNGLLADPVIRKNYQFWLYLYPTGLPIWSSAGGLRGELDRFNAQLSKREPHANLGRKILIGHSMGGLICSMLVREGGEKLWSQFSDIPASQLRLSPEAKQELLKILYFAPRADVSRVIFVSTPHRGSQLALQPIAGFFANLIQLPFSILRGRDEQSEILRNMRDDVRSAFVAPANSIRFLRARSPLLLAILRLPMTKSLPYHSIIGDRGKGNSPHSSDGVVPYWSSHLEGALSEKIVPSGHGANENPEGIAEIRRILVDAVGQRRPRSTVAAEEGTP